MTGKIRLNGELYPWVEPATAEALLAGLGLHPGTVVVEINRRICPRERLGEEGIREGDQVEVIRLVGGG